MEKRDRVIVTWIVIFAMVFVSLAVYHGTVAAYREKEWLDHPLMQQARTSKIREVMEYPYDAFVVGSSESSACTAEHLAEARGDHAFQCFYYGADMKEITDTVAFLLAYRKPKEILFPISLSLLATYSDQRRSKPISDSRYDRDLFEGRVNSAFLALYLGWLTGEKKGYSSLTPMTYLPDTLGTYRYGTGDADRRKQNIEDVDHIRKSEPPFLNANLGLPLTNQDAFFRDLEKIISMCEDKGISLKLAMCPIYESTLLATDAQQLRVFFQRLGDMADYWDFTYSSISKDPRFFYDKTHVRSAVGRMMIAKMYGQSERYVPEGFGVYVAKGSRTMPKEPTDVFQELFQDAKVEETNFPVLIYHHYMDAGAPDDSVVHRDVFRQQLAWIRELGFQTVSIREAIEYVQRGIPLPDKAVLITIDDGYDSNYTIAFPELKEAKAKATIFVIGHSVGKTTYKDTGKLITPHFDVEKGKEMMKSGLISIQSHSMDLHQSARLEGDHPYVRTSALRLDHETEADYIAHFRKDTASSIQQIEEEFGTPSLAYSYPLGKKDVLSEVLLNEMGFDMTFGAGPGDNTLVKGLPQTLLHLNRYNMTNRITKEQLSRFLSGSSE